MNPWTSKLVLAFGGLAATGYGLLYVPSLDGFGYAGHNGFSNPPSFLYWGGVETYHDPNVRAGSRGGPNVQGGGMHGGK